jgi:hypothetical protein
MSILKPRGERQKEKSKDTNSSAQAFYQFGSNMGKKQSWVAFGNISLLTGKFQTNKRIQGCNCDLAQ